MIRNLKHFLIAIPFVVSGLLLFTAIGLFAAVTPNQFMPVVEIKIVDDNDQMQSLGSGTIIDSSGYILTNYHVIEPALNSTDTHVQICITLNAENVPICNAVFARYVSGWSDLDVALLQIVGAVDKDAKTIITYTNWKNKTGLTLPSVNFNRNITDYGVSLGDEIDAYGYPGVGGQTITLTKGSVSGFMPGMTDAGDSYRWLIKTDAKLNHGNSGGAAFDAQGNFIGIPAYDPSGGGNIGYIISLPVINAFLRSVDAQSAPGLAETTPAVTSSAVPQTVPASSASPTLIAKCEHGARGADQVCTCNRGYGWSDLLKNCVALAPQVGSFPSQATTSTIMSTDQILNYEKAHASKTDPTIANKYKGQILSETINGQVVYWYVSPQDKKRYLIDVGTKNLKATSTKISVEDLRKIAIGMN